MTTNKKIINMMSKESLEKLKQDIANGERLTDKKKEELKIRHSINKKD